MRYRKLKAAFIVLALAIAALVAYLHWPARVRSGVPYPQAVQEVTSLYPVLDFKTEYKDPPHRVFHGDTASIRSNYPAYDYKDPLWDLDVTHQELVRGQKFEVTIINRSKFDRRETTITIEADGDGSRVTVESWEDVSGLLLPIPWRARSYERDRLREIRERLENGGH